MPPQDEGTLSFLQGESARYDENVRAILAQVYQFGALGFGLLGAGATLLADKGQYTPLLVIPPLGLVVWFMGIRALTEMYALAAYRDFLEKRMQELIAAGGSPGLFVRWESIGGRISGRSPQNYAVFGAFGVVQLVTGVGCFIGSWRFLPRIHSLAVTDIVASILASSLLLWLASRMLGTFDRVTALLESERLQLASAPPPDPPLLT